METGNHKPLGIDLISFSLPLIIVYKNRIVIKFEKYFHAQELLGFCTSLF